MRAGIPRTLMTLRPGRICAVLIVLAVASALFAASAGAEVAFSNRFGANAPGNIAIIGNTLETCPASAPTCAAGQAGTASGSALNNNGYVMRYVDVDADASTFNSSSATFALPSGAAVLFAGLYYGGRTSAGASGAAAPNPAARGTVLLKAPGASSYQTLAATVFTSTVVSQAYQGFVDVTSVIAAAGSGTYAVANVQSGTGQDRYAGWALVVAYRDLAQPPRNLAVFDGLQAIGSSDPPVSIPVSGFTTPPTGQVRTDVGFIAYEGDRGIGGDQATLDGVVLSDPTNPGNNFFNSAISIEGVSFTAKDPNYVNQLGFDAIIVNADGTLENAATSATIRVSTSGEQYLPGVISFATELYAPQVTMTKTVTDLNGGNVEPGDVLDYTVTVENTGQDGATDVVLEDAIPAGTTYVPGSLEIGGIGQTDATGDDEAEFLSGANQVVWRVGTGATATAGGTLAPGESAQVSFSVTVSVGVADGFVIENTALASFFAQTLGAPLQAAAVASTPVAAPDLTITKTHTGTFTPNGTFTLNVANAGGANSQGAITVTDTFPAGLTLPPSPYVFNAWTCTFAGQAMTCTYGNPSLFAGTNAIIEIPVTLVSGDANAIQNSAIVSGGGDGNPTNNASTDTVVLTPFADLGIGKIVTPQFVAAGEQATYQILVTNNGPFDAQDVTVQDTLPAGVAFISATASQGSCLAGVTCALGTIPNGATATVAIVVEAQTGAAASTIPNTATVTGNPTDPVADNDQATVDLTVTPTADLSVTKTISPAFPLEGTVITFAITAENSGPSPADGVVVGDQLPAIGSLISATPSQGSFDSTTGAWAVGTLGSGAQATLVVQWQLPPGSGAETVANGATARSDTRDGNADDNMATASELITPAADLDLTKFVTPIGAGPGETLTYTLTLTNNGPGTAQATTITDELPSTLTFVFSPDGCTAVAQTVTCQVGDLTAGQTQTFRVIAEVAADAVEVSVANTARASSPTPDPIDSNNTETNEFTVGVTPPTDEGAAPPTAGAPPPCDPLLEPCAPPSSSEQPPVAAPEEGQESGPATGRPRVPDLRGSVTADWDGTRLHIVLRVRIARPRLVARPFDVSLTIPGVLSRAVRIAPRGRRVVEVVLDVPAPGLAGDPLGKRLVARIDPDRRIVETRERNNTAWARVG